MFRKSPLQLRAILQAFAIRGHLQQFGSGDFMNCALGSFQARPSCKVLLCFILKPKWGFPKIRGTILGVPIIRTLVFWVLYWGPPYFGNQPNPKA